MTRLSALELFGFKSFADRTRFEFPDGITVVVGPNGSGKSNVVDAIKWVLGEQSPRSLRGKEMTDVIFAGSTARKPLNMAEVSLVFDNTARLLPVSSDAVQISRRVYRNGESEYLVNGEVSRLKDIRELFSGTGAATEAYSVIEQGRVDALLTASGRDRRAVFEEAAGITRFRSRRTEALRRLERAEQNRQRLADIVGEVASRLEKVRNQAARARRWKTLHDRLKTLRITAAGRDLSGVDATIADLDAAMVAARQLAADTETTGRELGEAVAELAVAVDAMQPRLAEARASAAADTQRITSAETTETLTRQRRHDFEAAVQRAERTLAAAIDAERDVLASEARAAQSAADIEASLAVLRRSLASHEEAVAGSHEEATTARAALAAATALLDDLERLHIRRDSALERLVARAADTQASADRAHAAVAAARERLALLGESRAASQGQLSSLRARLAGVDRDIDVLETAQRDATALLQTRWKDLAGWQSTLEACRERRSMLQDLVDRQEGVSEAARSLLAAGGAAHVPGFAGVLADLVVADVEWAPLIDVALGELGQSLVVDSLDDAVAWHAAWAGSNDAQAVLAAGGRIGFLAARDLREVAGFDPGPQPGIVGRLDRLVERAVPSHAPSSAADLIHRLLARVWLVERIDHALPLVPTAPAGTLFLTREGASLMADGGFAVGAAGGSSGLVARRSELRALEGRHDELQRTVTSIREEIEGLQAAIEARREDQAQATVRRQQATDAIATARAESDRIDRDETAAHDAIAHAERAARLADKEAAAAEAAVSEARRELADAEERLADAAAEVSRRRDAIELVERDRGQTIDAIQRLRIDEAATTEKLARARDAMAATATSLVIKRGEVNEARATLADARAEAEGHDREVLVATAHRAEAAWAAERTTSALTVLAAEAERLDMARKDATAAHESTRVAASQIADRLHALALEAGEARHQRARIVERIRDEYEIDIDAEQSLPLEAESDADEADPIPDDRAELESAIEELRRKVASMGSVNMEALQEAEELSSRLATLEGQLTDVTSGKQSIEELIARIDEESRRLLGETIETVRGHFRELFERVFGGGQADIVLEEGVDLLEASVEIVARPPGKEPRSISLLSGGEKTMTCVALLLAIFKSRPSPFCVLDEVDAALDEANVDRFVGVLRAFLSSTQFIVVTHSKKTMSAATTLYGVTMEESGVSKRVSVRFESTAAAARAA